MAKLDTYQQYANKCADKLGTIDTPNLRWGNECGYHLHKYTHAHCHIVDSPTVCRGTICLNRKWFAGATVKEWHHCIAHEVAHLAVKSKHNTATFDRRLVALGVANESERRNARSARKGHHHVWEYWYRRLDDGTQEAFRQCRVCHKKTG